MPTSDTRDQTFKMGAGEKVASSGKGEVKNVNPCDFASTPLKHTACNKQWLVETRKNFSGTDLILMIVSLITYVLDTVTGKQQQQKPKTALPVAVPLPRHWYGVVIKKFRP